MTRLTCNQTVAGEHADSGHTKNNGDGPSKKKKKIDQGLFNVQWKVYFNTYLPTSSDFHLTWGRRG
jgi:hypothetical protein